MFAYAQRLERYFCSVTECEDDLNDYANSFHEVLIAALSCYADAMSDSSFSVGELSGKQVSHMVTQLINAEAEVEAELELQRSVRRYYFPPYFEQLSGSSHNSLSSEVVDALANTCPSN